MPPLAPFHDCGCTMKKDVGRAFEIDRPVPLVGPIPEFEGGLVNAAELRVLLGRDEND